MGLNAVSAEAASSVVLSDSDVKNIKAVLSLQQKGEYTRAAKQTAKVKNPILNGYILYHKYMTPRYNTRKPEIERWLKEYSELAVAPEIYALGVRKKMRLRAEKPKDVLYGGKSKACSYIRRDEPIDLIRKRTFSDLSGAKKTKATQLFRKLRDYIQKGKTLPARQLIESKEFLSTLPASDIALARTALAFSYFLDGEFQKSLAQSKSAIVADAESTPLAYWTAGLASWQLKTYESAAEYFRQTAVHSQIYPLLRGSAAFWAARAYLKIGAYNQVGDFLEIASQQPRTFYGMLAMRLLGQDINADWVENVSENTLSRAKKFSDPALSRFYALKQIGRTDWAIKELTKLYLESDEETRAVLMAVSQQHDFQDDLVRLAGITTDEENDERFPLPNWKPLNGWKVDKALVYAFVRQESCFNPSAKSSAGARGLMQIMPATAKATAKMLGLTWSANRMDNPAYNLALGQKYLQYLMGLPAVSNNLIYLAVAYNGGPGNLIKWKKKTQYTDDSLMFIESIPSRETRGFVERIMVNYWAYRALTGQSLETMDDVIAGKWPLYRK